MANPSRDRFRDLLARFQDAHSRFGDAGIWLTWYYDDNQLLNYGNGRAWYVPAYPGAQDVDGDDDFGEPFCLLNLPFSTGSNAYTLGMNVVWFPERATEDQKQTFRELARTAGASLPSSIAAVLEHEGGQENPFDTDAATRWCALLYAASGRASEPPLGESPGGTKRHICRPFAASAWVIEYCELWTDSPKMPWLDELEGAVPVETPSIGTPDDPSAYVSAKGLWPSRFKRASDATKFLDKTPEIRSHQSPTHKQRRLVHAADWHRYWEKKDQQAREMLNTEAVQEVIADIEASKAQERRRKAPSRGK